MSTRRPDEHSREQVRQRWMIVPVADEAAQEIWTAQKRTVGGRRPADDNVVPTASTGVTPVEHELLGAETRQSRLLVQHRRVFGQLRPVLRWMQIDFDDAGIR